MRYQVIIPARYDSSRLPGKPLIQLCGVPMVVRTYRRVTQAIAPEYVCVATDDDRIRATCMAAGIQVVMTSPSCLTGTDRVAEVARRIVADTYINIQGDEPVFNPEDLQLLLRAAGEHPTDVLNGYCPIADEPQFRSSNTPKVVASCDGRLLYISRAPIPTNKSLGFAGAWRQVCAYAFPRLSLDRFASCQRRTPLESVEDIEILRFLELGYTVRMVPMSSVSVSVDSVNDVARAEQVIRMLGL
jgi:3-deoxy-manno-octulosonate cytidylyltransferase (CMP-KDO synthetase)